MEPSAKYIPELCRQHGTNFYCEMDGLIGVLQRDGFYGWYRWHPDGYRLAGTTRTREGTQTIRLYMERPSE